ncbi:MAG: FliA/WhiG family RNA polymerase sigma factor [Candidatus Electryonea clarkiae]|nr:FliA/WhiG family RNA polymerase sigma factor [Candidatus Electryonea clarkiae]MDP8288057.1 FliA/WhiG family RNA polymerase sigma factor [Candidatus Electryonea clarkiae]
MTVSDLAKLDADSIWKLWTDNRTQKIKDELVVRYIPLVRQVAGRLKMGLPNSVEIDELVSSGIIGLVSAINNYQISLGFKFETYAVPRIRGSILDGLRDYDWMPRSIRTKAKSLESVLVKLEGSLGRVPFDYEVAGEMELDINDYYSLIDEVKIVSILSLDEPYQSAEGDMSTLSEAIQDVNSPDLDGVLEWEQAKDIAKTMIKGLSQQERLVIALYYYEELTLREVGEILGISESRVSQIHSKIMLTLKGKLKLIYAEKSAK